MHEDPRNVSGGSILRRRYIGDDPERRASLEAERVNAQVAQMIYDRRMAAGLSQKQLAGLIGSKQSVISRLEDAEYEGHSLSMLQRIADALDQRIAVQMTARSEESVEKVTPTARTVQAAKRTRKYLEQRGGARRLTVLVHGEAANEAAVEVPEALVPIVARAIEELSQGHSLELVRSDEELTTRQAADRST